MRSDQTDRGFGFRAIFCPRGIFLFLADGGRTVCKGRCAEMYMRVKPKTAENAYLRAAAARSEQADHGIGFRAFFCLRGFFFNFFYYFLNVERQRFPFPKSCTKNVPRGPENSVQFRDANSILEKTLN